MSDLLHKAGFESGFFVGVKALRCAVRLLRCESLHSDGHATFLRPVDAFVDVRAFFLPLVFFVSAA